MSTHPVSELLQFWAHSKLSPEQTIGHLLQHVLLLTQRLSEAEKHIRQLEAATPTIKEPLVRSQEIERLSQ